MENGKKEKKKKKELLNSGTSSKKQKNNKTPCGTYISWRPSLNCVPRRCADRCTCIGITPLGPIYKPDDICIRCREIPRWKLKQSVISRSFVPLLLLLVSIPPQLFNVMDTRCSFAFTYLASTLTGVFFCLRSYGNDPISFISCEFEDASAAGVKSGL